MSRINSVQRYSDVLNLLTLLFVLGLMDGEEFLETTESILENPPRWLAKQKREKTLTDLLAKLDRDFYTLPEN